MKKVLNILSWIWEQPQTLIGAMLTLLFKRKNKKVEKYEDVFLVEWVWMMMGVSLGKFILLGSMHLKEKTKKHEYGHCKQSRMLGPLYLILVGIPSFIRATGTMFSKKLRENYYNGYPENWADKLGGVER